MARQSKLSAEPLYYDVADGYVWGIRLVDGTEACQREKLCRRLEIPRAYLNTSSGLVTLVLSFDYSGAPREIEVSRGVLTRARVSQLIEYGVDIPDHKVWDILRYLNYCDSHAPVISAHTDIGWSERRGQPVFLLNSGIGAESTYKGTLDLQPRGSYDAWLTLIQDEVLGYTPLELALVLGFTATTAAYIGSDLGMEVLVCHLYGDSSQGKTTASMLAVASYGLPDWHGSGLMATWSGTENAIRAHFRGIRGVPVALDEASVYCGDDYTRLIYTLAQGKDKDRLNRDGRKETSATWEGLILSNAEHSLQANSGQNTGLKMRLIEIGNVVWTRSAENSDALKTGLLRNCGHSGPRFAEYLIGIGRERVIERWESWRRRVVDVLGSDDRFAARMGGKLAAVVVTAELASEALKIQLSTEAIMNMLVQIEESSRVGRDLASNAMEYFIEAVTANRRKFASATSNEEAYECWGSFGADSSVVCVLPHVFASIMRDGGFDNKDVILKEWRDRGWLDCDPKRLTRKKAIHHVGSEQYRTPRVHVVRVPSQYMEPSTRQGHLAEWGSESPSSALTGFDGQQAGT